MVTPKKGEGSGIKSDNADSIAAPKGRTVSPENRSDGGAAASKTDAGTKKITPTESTCGHLVPWDEQPPNDGSAGPSPAKHFEILKPSRLKSMSIAVSSTAIVVVEKNERDAIVMQSLARRWAAARRFAAARAIALRCQGAYRGRAVRDGISSFRTSYVESSVETSYTESSVGTSYTESSVGTSYAESSVGTSYAESSVGTSYAESFVSANSSIRAAYAEGSVGTSYAEGSVGTSYAEGSVSAVSFQHYCAARIQAARHYCAMRIQAAARGYLGFLFYTDTRTVVVLVQSFFRMQQARRRYCAQCKLALHCQTNTRRFLAKRRVSELRWIRMNSFAAVIQTNYRRHVAKRRFRELRWTLARELRAEESAIKIQSCWRMYMALVCSIVMFSDIIACQSVARRWMAKRRCGRLLLRRDEAATSIQKLYRGYSGRLDCQVLVELMITCQSAVRRWIARRRFCAQRRAEEAAVRIQAACVGFAARKEYLRTLRRIVICQGMVRRMAAAKERRERARVRSALEFALKEWAATKIRAAYLGHAARADYRRAIGRVVLCQCAARRTLAMRRAGRLRYARWHAMRGEAVRRIVERNRKQKSRFARKRRDGEQCRHENFPGKK